MLSNCAEQDRLEFEVVCTHVGTVDARLIVSKVGRGIAFERSGFASVGVNVVVDRIHCGVGGRRRDD